MKNILFVLLLSQISLTLFAQNGDPNGYQCAKWGMTLKSIKECFNKDWVDETNFAGGGIWFPDVIAGYEAEVCFYFYHNKLSHVIVGVNLKQASHGDISVAFSEIGELLAGIYGKPNSSAHYLIPKEAAGDKWEFKNTRIELVTSFTNSYSSSPIQISYTSTILETQIKADKLKKERNKL